MLTEEQSTRIPPFIDAIIEHDGQQDLKVGSLIILFIIKVKSHVYILHVELGQPNRRTMGAMSLLFDLFTTPVLPIVPLIWKYTCFNFCNDCSNMAPPSAVYITGLPIRLALLNGKVHIHKQINTFGQSRC